MRTRGGPGEGRDGSRDDGGRGQGDGEGGWRKDRKRLRGGGARYEVPSFAYLVRCLNRDNLLPAIVFIFSRNGCDQAAREVAKSSGRPLVSTEESEELLRRLEVGHHERMPPSPPPPPPPPPSPPLPPPSSHLLSSHLLSSYLFSSPLQAFEASAPEGTALEPERRLLLENGIGIHHAGLLPLHKSLVEDLFNSGLLKVCFATETLAAGVNMPARTTVISCLSKRTGSGIAKLTSAQLLQMAGRAGRRGKDVQGNVVLMRSRFEDAEEAHRMMLQV